MRNTSQHLVDYVPSLRIVQAELARYERTGDPLHLAHAQRAIDDAQDELAALSRRRWREDLRARLGGDVPGLSERN